MVQWPNESGFDTDYEEHEPVELSVLGRIPNYAAGVLYRTGPQGYKIQTSKGNTWAANHWFDGFSCIHRFEINFKDGSPRVTYRSRRTADKMIEMVRKDGKLSAYTFGAQRDICESVFAKVMSIFESKSYSENVGVTLSINMPGGGSRRTTASEKPAVSGHTNSIETLHVKTDYFAIKKIDPVTLEPGGMFNQSDLHPELAGGFSASHTKTDPDTGDLFNFNMTPGRVGTYKVFRTSAATGGTDVLATIESKAAYIHSTFLSKNYVIVCVWNSHVRLGGLPILLHGNVLDSIMFDPTVKAKWYVVSRHGKGVVATFESDPFFCFHTINAWEEPCPTDVTKTDIFCEYAAYDNTDVIRRFFYDNLINKTDAYKAYAGEKRLACLPSHTQMRLLQVDDDKSPSTARPAERVFQADKSVSSELPTINPLYLTRRHRYTYGCADRLKSTFMDGLVKFDNTTQTSIFWEHEAHTPGEAIFIANPNGTEEDDGVLLSVVLNGKDEKSYLLVLDAKDLSEIGRAEMRGPMAFGFHGTYKAKDRMYGGDI